MNLDGFRHWIALDSNGSDFLAQDTNLTMFNVSIGASNDDIDFFNALDDPTTDCKEKKKKKKTLFAIALDRTYILYTYT